MAHLAAPLAFPLGGDFYTVVLPSGRIPIGPIGAPDPSVTGGAVYFNSNYPPGAPYAYGPFNSTAQGGGWNTVVITGAPNYSLNFLRWFYTYPPTFGSFVVDLVMPAGWNNTEQWYFVAYVVGGDGSLH